MSATTTPAPQAADTPTTAVAIITKLFARHGITDPTQAHRLIRERFTDAQLDAYKHARDLLDGSGVLG